MKAALLRTGSNPVHQLNWHPSSGSPKNGPVPSTKISFTGLRRSSSDSDMIRVDSKARLNSIGSVSFSDMSVILEEDMEFDFMADWPGNGNGHGHGHGNGKGNKYDRRRTGNGNGGNEEKSKIGEYYQQMLKSNPGDPLLLRNYGKYLHEVEKNTEKAEECYGRAILASPGDGELLSLYGNLIWETQKDEDRAQSYFDRAVHASPDDCMVLGSYAHFLWEADEDEDDEEIKQASVIPQAPAIVGAY